MVKTVDNSIQNPWWGLMMLFILGNNSLWNNPRIKELFDSIKQKEDGTYDINDSFIQKLSTIIKEEIKIDTNDLNKCVEYLKENNIKNS